MLEIYTKLGFEHILDPKGYDHILFVIALCAVYVVKDWKKVLVLVTAFTIGHSLTLALSSLRIISISADLVETLIPVTIVLTCCFNILKGRTENDRNYISYSLALGFGFIHGLGFSNFFKAMLGQEESITGPLFFFNIGVEIGQIIIVILTLFLSYVVVDILKVKQKYFNYIVSGCILIWATKMIFF
ncbi:MAG: HupE/UreJ family protein [Saprospiraceae bacterium]|nr:HupE/UreJ family protein [Saprospiraceae bacterium]